MIWRLNLTAGLLCRESQILGKEINHRRARESPAATVFAYVGWAAGTMMALQCSR